MLAVPHHLLTNNIEFMFQQTVTYIALIQRRGYGKVENIMNIQMVFGFQRVSLVCNMFNKHGVAGL